MNETYREHRTRTEQERTEKLRLEHPANHPETYQPEHHDGRQQLEYNRFAQDSRIERYKLEFKDALEKNDPQIAKALNHRVDLPAELPKQHKDYTDAIARNFGCVEFVELQTMRQAARDIAQSVYQPTHEALDRVEDRASGQQPSMEYIESRISIMALEANLYEDLCRKGAESLNHRHREIIQEELFEQAGIRREPGTMDTILPDPIQNLHPTEQTAYITAVAAFAARALNADIQWGKTYQEDYRLKEQQYAEFRQFQDKLLERNGFVDLTHADQDLTDRYRQMRDELEKPFGRINWENVKDHLNELCAQQAIDPMTAATALSGAEECKMYAYVFPDRKKDPVQAEKEDFIASIKFLTEARRGTPAGE